MTNDRDFQPELDLGLPDPPPRRRGRPPVALVRHGGGLPDETFASAADAARWLNAHGHPSARGWDMLAAIKRGTGPYAYGYFWYRLDAGGAPAPFPRS